jgi:hypothetical protein
VGELCEARSFSEKTKAGHRSVSSAKVHEHAVSAQYFVKAKYCKESFKKCSFFERFFEWVFGAEKPTAGKFQLSLIWEHSDRRKSGPEVYLKLIPRD